VRRTEVRLLLRVRVIKQLLSLIPLCTLSRRMVATQTAEFSRQSDKSPAP